MKKVILTALTIASLQFAQSQTQAMSNEQPKIKTEDPTPEQMAARQSAHLQKVLTLTDDQKQRVYAAIVKRATAMQQLKSTGEKPTKTETAPVKEQFIKDVNATLTPEQQKKWEDFRLQQKQNKEARKNQQAAPANGTTAPVKLESTDDGLK
jgi:protein CpxP